MPVSKFQTGADRKKEDETKFSVKQCLPFCKKEIIGKIVLDQDTKASCFFFLNGDYALCKRNRKRKFFFFSLKKDPQ